MNIEQLVEELKNKQLVIKQTYPVIEYLLSKPTDSKILNSYLEIIARQCSRMRDPDTAAINRLMNMTFDDIKPLAKRELVNILEPKLRVDLLLYYPNITDDQIRQVAEVFADMILDKVERIVFAD